MSPRAQRAYACMAALSGLILYLITQTNTSRHLHNDWQSAPRRAHASTQSIVPIAATLSPTR
jgi:hypothetical protein